VEELWASKVEHALKANVDGDGDSEAAPSGSSIKVLAEMTTFGAHIHPLVHLLRPYNAGHSVAR
jgi:hypothetical protein